MQTIFITGAGRGIGRSIALRFAKQGVTLGLVCQNHIEELEETERLCKKNGAVVYCYQGNVADFDFVQKCTSDFLHLTGKIDCLINNAGRSKIGLLTDMSIEDWNEIMGSNVTSVFNTCHSFVPSMVNQKHGRIINISSVWGNVGASCEVIYSASKGGVNAFTKALAKELGPSNISVNAISLGTIDTKMNDWLSKEEQMQIEDEIPMGRFGTTKEAADMVYNIATAPEYLTGQIITMDGGWC